MVKPIFVHIIDSPTIQETLREAADWLEENKPTIWDVTMEVDEKGWTMCIYGYPRNNYDENLNKEQKMYIENVDNMVRSMSEEQRMVLFRRYGISI